MSFLYRCQTEYTISQWCKRPWRTNLNTSTNLCTSYGRDNKDNAMVLIRFDSRIHIQLEWKGLSYVKTGDSNIVNREKI